MAQLIPGAPQSSSPESIPGRPGPAQLALICVSETGPASKLRDWGEGWGRGVFPGAGAAEICRLQPRAPHSLSSSQQPLLSFPTVITETFCSLLLAKRKGLGELIHTKMPVVTITRYTALPRRMWPLQRRVQGGCEQRNVLMVGFQGKAPGGREGSDTPHMRGGPALQVGDEKRIRQPSRGCRPVPLWWSG